MRTPSGQMKAPPLQALLNDGKLAGEWALDPIKSSIGLKSRSMWGLTPVNGVFRRVSGNGTVCADGAVSGTVTVAAASIETKNARRDTHLRSADFFDSGNNPDITFTADGIRPCTAPSPSTPSSPGGKRMRVAGTGATGLTGRTVTRLLRPGGDEVAALSRNRGRSCSAGPGQHIRGPSAVKAPQHRHTTGEGGNR